MRHNPHLFEINTLPFLHRLIIKYNRQLTLGSVPDEEWQEIGRLGFDMVWLMGIWQRSPTARRIALTEPSLTREYDKVLPGWTAADIAGSPYAVYDYNLDPALGTPEELVKLRTNLNRNGLGLIPDASSTVRMRTLKHTQTGSLRQRQISMLHTDGTPISRPGRIPSRLIFMPLHYDRLLSINYLESVR
jgi:hypothetical protein